MSFVLQRSIKKILDNPGSRSKLPNKSLEGSETSTGGGVSVGSPFVDDEEYGKGSAPDIALNNANVVVGVHEGLTKGTIDYKVGTISGKTVNWSKRHKYDTGAQPSVSVNDQGLVVEVHESHHTDRLWYRVGSVSGDKINFGDSQQYDRGRRPSVAISEDRTVVEVHKSQNFDSLYYHVGRVNGNTISFGSSESYDKGIRPSVAINRDGLVVEVHQSQNHESLWYRTGIVGGSKIEWFNGGESTKYAEGKRPDVAVTSDGQVIVVHQKGDTLWHRMGQVNRDSIDWFFESKQYNSSGATPGVACNDARAAEIHSEGDKTLAASVMTLRASQPKWTKTQGQYAYLRFLMEETEAIDERTVTSETITVKPGAAFLTASITSSRKSPDFPDGAVLSITSPSGLKYAEESSTDRRTITKAGSTPSLWSLVIKEPEAGDYKVKLTVPTNVKFSFVFTTLPYANILETIAASGGLQKRAPKSGPSANNPFVQQAIGDIALVWVTFVRSRNRIRMVEEEARYFTGADEPVTNDSPASVPNAVATIAQNIQIPNLEDRIQPPDIPTRPIDGGPIVGYVRNQDGALLWTHAEIRREHLDTGTEPSDAMRTFAHRLGRDVDQAGHAIANRLGGTGRQPWNIFPQIQNINTGVFRSDIEDLIYQGVRNQGLASVWLVFHYGDLQLPNRPTRFDILIRLPDGTEEINEIVNPTFIPRGA